MAEILRDTDFDFAGYMRDTEAQHKVQPAGVWIDEIIASIGKHKHERRVVLPWLKSHELFAFRPGEVTCWAGVNGNGKSLITGLAVLSFIGQGETACIASFEMKPRKTLDRMGRQFAGQNPSAEEASDPDVAAVLRDIYEQFKAYSDGKLWLYDQQGTVKHAALLGVIRYCANELKIRHFVIDSLMKCVAGEDDYNGQKSFVDTLCAYARDFGIHIHLVHHLRKLGSEADKPDKSDVKGSGSIVDQVDNLLLVWRNKPKEKDRQVGKKVDENEPDCMLICDKQRNGEWEGRIGLWWHAEAQQFVANPGAPVLDFARFPHEGRPW